MSNIIWNSFSSTKYFEFYSPGKANLQFSVCETRILREIKFGNFRSWKTALYIMYIDHYSGFEFWFLIQIPHLKMLQMPNIHTPQPLKRSKWHFLSFCNCCIWFHVDSEKSLNSRTFILKHPVSHWLLSRRLVKQVWDGL